MITQSTTGHENVATLTGMVQFHDWSIVSDVLIEAHHSFPSVYTVLTLNGETRKDLTLNKGPP